MKQRMRRISALLLVALMCVSCVVPAFAAENEGCPEIHTKTNCEATQIGEPHEAACGEQGYTTYQCNECKAYFADDFVPSKGEHAYQIVMQAATCTEDGFMKSVCLNCGDEEIVDAEDSEMFKAPGHQMVAKNAGEVEDDPDGNCKDGVVCAVCGVTGDEIGDELHEWGEPELLKVPTHDTNNDVKKGSAKFTCEICGETKTVDVYCDEDCVYVVDFEKFPSCEETGYKASATCQICGKKVHVKKLDSCTGWTVCDIPGCDHGDTEGCEFKWICEDDECGHFVYTEHCDDEDCDHKDCDDKGCEAAPYAEIDEIICTKSVEYVVELPTCTKEGSAYKVCTMCESIIGTPVTLHPTGHNYQTRIYEVVTAGGMTADEIAMYDGMGEGVAEGTTHKYTFYVKTASGKLAEVTGEAVIPAVLGKDETLTADTTTATPSTPDEDEVYYVWTGEYQNDDPLSKDAKGQDYMHWAHSCSSTTAHSYYTYVCIECDHSEPTVSFTGHYWAKSETLSTPAVCKTLTDGTDVYVCANPNCDGKNAADVDDADAGVTYSVNAEGNAVKTVVVKAAHVFETRTEEPTCKTEGYTVDECKVCKTPDLTKAAAGHGKSETDTKKDGWYDIVAIDPEAHDDEDVIIRKVTCTADGMKNVVCSICDKVLQSSVTIEALDHKADTEKGKVKADTEATCQTAGYSYYYCANEGCNEIVPVEIKAKQACSYTVKEEVAPNCQLQKAGYTVIKCKWCKEVSDETADPVAFDETNADHHGASYLKLLYVTKGNCTTLDTVVYECNLCKALCTKEMDYEGQDGKGNTYGKGEGSGHKYEEVEANPATCVADGNIAHYECSVCGALAADEEGETALTAADVVLKKLTEGGTHPEDKLVTSDRDDPTCTKNGHEAGTKCTACGAWVIEEDDIPKLGHDWHTVDSRTANCTEWGYEYQVCTREDCDAEKIIKYVDDFGGHKIDEKDTSVVPTCDSFGWTDTEYCTNEGCVLEDKIVTPAEKIAKVAHENAKGEKFYGTCTDTVEDRVCVVCKAGKLTYTDADGKEQTLTFECEFDGDHDHVEDIVKADGTVLKEDTQGAHSWVRTYVEATCMEYSYTLVVCEHCGYNYMEGEGFEYADEHLYWGDWKVKEEATTIKEGLKVRVCECGAKEEVVIPALAGLEIEVELENGVKPGYDLPDNGLVNVVVSTNASDLDVWGIRVELEYTGNVDYKDIVSRSAKFSTGATANVIEEENKIIIIATAPNDADGKLANVNLDGLEELITLQFKLDDAKKGESIFVKVDAEMICEVTDKDQNLIASKVVNEYSVADQISVKATSGDVVANNYVDIYDAKALMLYVTGEAEEEYNSAADMDQDGVVTMTDFGLMQNKLLMKKPATDTTTSGSTTTGSTTTGSTDSSSSASN